MECLVIGWIMCGVIGAGIAGSKGRGNGTGFIVGVLLGPLGLLMLLLGGRTPEAEARYQAQVRACGATLAEEDARRAKLQAAEAARRRAAEKVDAEWAAEHAERERSEAAQRASERETERQRRKTERAGEKQRRDEERAARKKEREEQRQYALAHPKAHLRCANCGRVLTVRIGEPTYCSCGQWLVGQTPSAK